MKKVSPFLPQFLSQLVFFLFMKITDYQFLKEFIELGVEKLLGITKYNNDEIGWYIFLSKIRIQSDLFWEVGSGSGSKRTGPATMAVRQDYLGCACDLAHVSPVLFLLLLLQPRLSTWICLPGRGLLVVYRVPNLFTQQIKLINILHILSKIGIL